MHIFQKQDQLILHAGMISMSALAECLEVPEQHVQVSTCHLLVC